MKKWLGAISKLLLEFLTLLGFLSAAGAFAATLASPGPEALALAAVAEALKAWPTALAIALTTGVVSFGMIATHPVRGLLTVTLAGLVLAGAGTWARANEWGEPPVARRQPIAGQVVAVGDRVASAASLGASQARDVITLDWSAPPPRLAVTPTAPFDAASGRVKVNGTNWDLLPSRDDSEDRAPAALAFLDALPPPLARSEASGSTEDLARSAAFVIFCVGLGSLTLRIRRPMTALIAAILIAGGVLIADGWVVGSSLPAMVGDMAAGLGLAIAGIWIVPGMEAIVGLLAAGTGLALARSTKK